MRVTSTGHLHLRVHTLLGSHRESASKLVRDRARSTLCLDLHRATTEQLRLAEQCPCVFGERSHNNAHKVGMADQARIQSAVNRTLKPISPGPGLLLQALAGPAGGSVRLSAIDLIRQVQDQTGKRRHELQDALGRGGPLVPWQKAVWSLPTLCEQIPADAERRDELVKAVDRDLNRWVNACRVLLGYVAPMVTLTSPCPHCDQASLIVREDATSDVVCITEDCVDENGDQSRWGREHWKALLEGRYASGLVNTEAAAMHLGVTAGTIRDWKRRGLISPATDPGGTPLGTSRQPFWVLAHLIDAAAAPKPRRTA